MAVVDSGEVMEVGVFQERLGVDDIEEEVEKRECYEGCEEDVEAVTGEE